MPSVSVVNDCAYVVGGRDDNEQFLSDIWKFDGILNSWEKCPLAPGSLQMPPTTGHYSVYLPGRKEVLLISVGEDGNRDRQVLSLDTENMRLYKPRTKGEQPFLMPYSGFCCTSNAVFIFGGKLYGPPPHETNDLNILLLDNKHLTLTWSKLEVGNYVPRPRRSSTLSFVAGRLFLIGGRNDQLYMPDVDMFDIKTGTWHRVLHDDEQVGVEPSEYSYGGDRKKLAGHCAIVTGGKLYVIGGDVQNRVNPARHVLAFQHDTR